MSGASADMRSPSFWLAANAACLVFSLINIVLIALGPERPGDHCARQFYLIYNFLTSTIWCLDIGCGVFGDVREELNMRNDSSDKDSKRRKFMAYGELIIAVYFLLDSLVVVIKWKMPKHDHTNGMLVDCIINAFAYAFATYTLSCTIVKDRKQAEGGYVPIDGD